LTRCVAIFLSTLAVCVLMGQPSAAQAKSNQRPIVCTVQAGDSLWAISGRVHVQISKIESLNHLTDRSILQPGQTLVIRELTMVAAQRVRHPAIANHAVALRSAARPKTSVRRLRRTTMSAGNAHTLASQAVWNATHAGPTAPPLIAPFGFAQEALAFDARITGTALRYLGVPYVWGGTSFGGVDCSGFVWAVFAKNGIYLPRTADAQYESGRHVSTRDLRAGDLVFFQTYALGASHVGIYLGNGKFVHASSSNGVRVDQLAEDYYSARYLGARRLAKVAKV
jgi:cell wall-associated NlpC family hydrolase